MWISQKFLVSLVGLGLISACTAQQVPPAPVAPLPSTPAIDPVAQQLIGTWSAQADGGNDSAMLTFTPQGKLLVLQSLDNQTLATQFEYAIDPQPKPMHLDLKPQKPQVTENETAKTVFEVTPKGELVLPPLPTMKPAQARPTKVEGITYQKVSNATTLQPNPQVFAEVLPLKSPQGTPAQLASQESLLYVKMLAMAQQTFYLDQGTFANSLQQLGNPKTETDNYRYQMDFLGSELVSITAQAKRPKLPSLISVVFKLKPVTIGYDVVFSTGCITEKPAPPQMPKLNFSTGKITCPAGSQEY